MEKASTVLEFRASGNNAFLGSDYYFLIGEYSFGSQGEPAHKMSELLGLSFPYAANRRNVKKNYWTLR